MMKKSILSIAIFSFLSCNETTIEVKLYTIDDLPPLTNELKVKYFEDAATLEFSVLIRDSILKNDQVYLRRENIEYHYENLLLIYNNSYKLSNSFFENFMSIHNRVESLKKMMATVDTSKKWVENIIAGNQFTGVPAIDSLLALYELNLEFDEKFYEYYYLTISSETPYNIYALSNKLMETNEFESVGEIPIIQVVQNSIGYRKEGNLDIYYFFLAYCSDCYHPKAWDISIDENKKVKLHKVY